MKYEDTVMTFTEQSNEMKIAKVLPGCLVRKQAEISFKAGFKYALEGAVMEGAFGSIKKLGIKEVVDWILENNGQPDHILDLWEAQLKEWGINED